MKPIEIKDATFEQEVLHSPQLTIVDFWAPWCGPCKLIASVLDAIAQEYDGRVKVTKLNVDENPATANAFAIRSIPTLLFIRGGKVVDKFIGTVPRNQFDLRIQRLLDLGG